VVDKNIPHRQVEIITNGVLARTMTCVSGLLREALLFEPKYLVLHAGIVDCAPRIFSLK
jgi:hypothetical protein